MIAFTRVSKIYPDGTRGLDDVTLTIDDGEFVAVIGRSGAGKSTLLRTVNALTEATSGDITIDDESVRGARGRRLRALRGRIGMIFQSFNLVGVSTVQRNVIAGRLAHVPAWRGTLGLFRREDYRLVTESLQRVGLAEKLHARADELSGGQQQRVAIARALVQNPSILLADEPVASLDPVTTDRIMADLRDIGRELGITVVMSLHSVPLARAYATRIIGLRDGAVVFDGPTAEATDARLRGIYGDEYAALISPEAAQARDEAGTGGASGSVAERGADSVVERLADSGGGGDGVEGPRERE
ncbi:phosphonates import ATP-binding protein PhnC [Pseudoclavibacter endophyticus]|uniref:phosphonate ABC transporter ATP-binding protein n=1 Tax=Pseudoclavibacter endophyticus TaxID=1778590 RepID=UPI0016658352|nr:phosphonate ABC transporter ATP-binding protein [Pseudoclavibacter endophyticus]GGA71371.1 phosphonates import ATP-binding protein PhnC [Pseudoclavibacter endophyticus]